MVEAGGNRDLAQEPLRAQRGRDLGPQHLQRDGPIVLLIVGEIHRRHAAAAELALDAVPARQRCSQAHEPLN